LLSRGKKRAARTVRCIKKIREGEKSRGENSYVRGQEEANDDERKVVEVDKQEDESKNNQAKRKGKSRTGRVVKRDETKHDRINRKVRYPLHFPAW